MEFGIVLRVPSLLYALKLRIRLMKENKKVFSIEFGCSFHIVDSTS